MHLHEVPENLQNVRLKSAIRLVQLIDDDIHIFLSVT